MSKCGGEKTPIGYYSFMKRNFLSELGLKKTVKRSGGINSARINTHAVVSKVILILRFA